MVYRHESGQVSGGRNDVVNDQSLYRYLWSCLLDRGWEDSEFLFHTHSSASRDHFKGCIITHPFVQYLKVILWSAATLE